MYVTGADWMTCGSMYVIGADWMTCGWAYEYVTGAAVVIGGGVYDGIAGAE